MRALLIATAIFLSGCNTVSFGWEKEQTMAVDSSSSEKIEGLDGPSGGHFDDDGNWIPDNKEIAATYKIPDISAGFIFDLSPIGRQEKKWWDGMALPSIQIELMEFDSNVPYLNKVKFDFGVGYKRVYIYAGKLWTNIFEISTGVFVGWDWDSNDISYGLGATIIKF